MVAVGVGVTKAYALNAAVPDGLAAPNVVNSVIPHPTRYVIVNEGDRNKLPSHQ